VSSRTKSPDKPGRVGLATPDGQRLRVIQTDRSRCEHCNGFVSFENSKPPICDGCLDARFQKWEETAPPLTPAERELWGPTDRSMVVLAHKVLLR
jgi:hypothetical protein